MNRGITARSGSVRGCGIALGLAVSGTIIATNFASACTRILWNTNDGGPVIVGRNEDYVSASQPTLVATPRGIERTGTEDPATQDRAIRWTVNYGNIAIYANNRFPNDGINEAGLTARTLFYLDGDPNETVAPDSEKLELDQDHWVSFVLDNFATVAEAVEAMRNEVYLVSIKGGKGYSYATPKHLAMADATGDSAIFEITKGELEIFHGPQYAILTNPPSYRTELENAKKYQSVAVAADLPSGLTSEARFARANYWQHHLPKTHGGDAATAYGFMYSALGNVVLPAGSPVPTEVKQVVEKLIAELADPAESYGVATYFQTISDLTNKHYRFNSLIAPSDVHIDLADYDFSAGQPVRVIKHIDQYAQHGWSSDIAPHLVAISGDIYDEPVD